MIEFVSIFLTFLYFKIARVHKKEEKMDKVILLQHIIVAISAIVMFIILFKNGHIISALIESFISFIAASMMITAVQVGVFVDGKPFIGLSKIYKYLFILTALIVLFVGLLALK